MGPRAGEPLRFHPARAAVPHARTCVLQLVKFRLHLRLRRAWYQPGLSTRLAELVVRGEPAGTFVVHRSDAHALALTVEHPTHPVTTPIAHVQGTFSLGVAPGETFATLDQLVLHYVRHCYMTAGRGTPLTLLDPRRPMQLLLLPSAALRWLAWWVMRLPATRFLRPILAEDAHYAQESVFRDISIQKWAVEALTLMLERAAVEDACGCRGEGAPY